MIATGIHIPNVVLKRLASNVAEILRETAPMTVGDFRKSHPERVDANLTYYFHVNFTKTGAIKNFHTRPIQRSVETFREHGFEADVMILGRASVVAMKLAEACGEFLLRRVEGERQRNGEREFVTLSDDQLETAADELEYLKSRPYCWAHDCGSLSEKLKLRLIEREVETRSNESRHQRIHAIAQNADFLVRCKASIDAETKKATEWRAMRGHWWIASEFQGRSDVDQTIIAFRKRMGWEV